jgi:hypothetical protein
VQAGTVLGTAATRTQGLALVRSCMGVRSPGYELARDARPYSLVK